MEQGFFSNKLNQFLGALVLLATFLALLSYTLLNLQKSEYTDPMPPMISVSGEGEVLAIPDVGQFSFSVQAEADTAEVAQTESGVAVNSILDYLREQGIEDKDIATENYNLWPRYRWEERICLEGVSCPGPERVQDGFEVNQTIRVKVRDTDLAPSIIAGVGERGATNISRLNFTIDDVDALREEARALAIDDAQAKAAILADQLGVQILQLASYNENRGYIPSPYMLDRAMSADAEEAGYGGAELPVGEESTTVTVNLTYRVR
jgi:uncharacterized protein YggE